MFQRFTLIFIILVTQNALAGTKFDTDEKKASYALGINTLHQLQAQGITLNEKAFLKGFSDAINGRKPALDSKAMRDAIMQLQTKLREKRQAQQAQQSEAGKKNIEIGKKFLEANAKKDGVKTTASGLQYKIIKPGKGKKPKATDTVVTHYKGTLIDGREFDSSYKRNKPAEFPVKGVIKGWTEALQLMKVGAKWELYIPADLAYGASQRGPLIEPNSTLIFELELLDIKK